MIYNPKAFISYIISALVVLTALTIQPRSCHAATNTNTHHFGDPRTIVTNRRSGRENAVYALSVPNEQTKLSIATRGGGPSLKNIQERAGSTVLLIAPLILLIKYGGVKGMIGLIMTVQLGMYFETIRTVENGSGAARKIGSFLQYQQWHWFGTVFLATTGRALLLNFGESLSLFGHTLTATQLDRVVYGMAAVSLLLVVLGMNGIGKGEESMTEGEHASELRFYLSKLVSCQFSLFFVVAQSSFWIRTLAQYGVNWILFPSLLVIINDTMAYVFGCLFGKHPLLPRLSPKKTWEGFTGAFLSTLLAAVPLWNQWSLGNNVKDALYIAAFVSIVAPFGGFLASAVKRAHGAKDFGDLIPGHGGLCDRLDCHVITAPFIYLYLKGVMG